MPPRQRRRGFRLARDPRLLRLRHPDRPHRHPEGDRIRLQHPLLRRAGVHLLAQAGHPRRLPRPLQGGQGPPRPSTSKATAREKGQPTATATRSRTASTTKDFDRNLVIDERTKRVAARRSASSSREAATASRRPSSSVSTPNTPPACARRSSTRTPISCRKQPLRHAHHRRRRRGPGQLGNFIDPESNPRASSPPRACSPPASMPRPAA
jgi:hypothetical protein